MKHLGRKLTGANTYSSKQRENNVRARSDCMVKLVSCFVGNSPRMDIAESGLEILRDSIVLLDDDVGNASSSSSPSEMCPVPPSPVGRYVSSLYESERRSL